MEKKHTERGFLAFENDRLYVCESSLAFDGPHVRIYGGRDKDGHVHLSLADAKNVIASLQSFVTEAEAGNLTEKP